MVSRNQEAIPGHMSWSPGCCYRVFKVCVVGDTNLFLLWEVVVFSLLPTLCQCLS
jgi:hypothetical protein